MSDALLVALRKDLKFLVFSQQRLTAILAGAVIIPVAIGPWTVHPLAVDI
jgi:hypothetical protein